MTIYAVLGLGYVGLGLAAALGKKAPTYGYDINSARINELKRHIDRNKQISSAELKKAAITYTDNIQDMALANFFMVTVSTPAQYYDTPDLKPLISAVKTLATILKKGDTVVFESTVYPGTTEEICIPLLEEISQLKNQLDFNVGYSPERINPGDNLNQLHNITKVIGAQNAKTLDKICQTYQSICEHIYPVSSIKAAEAVKILENTQRDVNIALMNEFTKIMHALGLNTHEIIEGAKTKWSFLPFKPGFVGGHCISIDPHYLAFKAKRVGVYPELILTARHVNDAMTEFVIKAMLNLMVQQKINLKKVVIGVLGLTYKENVNDIRNSLSLKLIKELKLEGFKCLMHDPIAHTTMHDGRKIDLLPSIEGMKNASLIILTVAHDYYRDIGLTQLMALCKDKPIIMDIPNLFVEEAKQHPDLVYWSL